MALKKAASIDTDSSGANYPKKYWWLVLVVVPIVIALIQYRPWRNGTSTSGTSITFDDVSVIVNEAAQSGTALNEELINQLKLAVASSREGQHDTAVAAVEKVRDSSSQVAALPSLLIGLADEYRLSGREEDARRTYQTVLKKDPTNERILDGLSRLPDAPLDEGITLVNFTSQLHNLSGYEPASHMVDGKPSSAWISGSSEFPHTLIFALSARALISEVSFNNPAYGNADRNAKDIEISVSSQSATSGFTVVATAVLAKNDIGQGVRLKSPAAGQWIKVRILTNHGNKEETSLGDISVSGRFLEN
jgi:tetratricopeptide (TPR) repeat protein